MASRRFPTTKTSLLLAASIIVLLLAQSVVLASSSHNAGVGIGGVLRRRQGQQARIDFRATPTTSGRTTGPRPGTYGAPSLARRQQYITDEDTTNPIQAAKDVQQIPYLSGNASGVTDTDNQLVSGDSDEAQLPQNTAVPFIQTASTTADAAGGWQAIPQVEGFTLNRSWSVVPGAIMPFYITSGVDPTQVKRAVITYPGKPRDAWKYANLYRNALSVVYANTTSGVANNSVVIISPVWLNDLDQQAGGVQQQEIYFRSSAWEYGGASQGPTLPHSLEAYEIMDNFTDMLFDQTQWPALNQVVIAGHSMGGQASHRYALLKKQKKYDDNMSYWVGNPGSWTYLSDQRPYQNTSCADTYDTWQYGIGQNTTKIPKYARKDVIADKQTIVQRYLNRKIHMALGLLDNGAGDTHCQAQYQGGNHLDRGSQFVLHLANLSNGQFPASQTVDFIGNTSHQDYAMISTDQSLHWLFVNDYNNRYPDIVPHNPSETAKSTPHTATPKPKAYATHGNQALASGLLGGSLLGVIVIFSLLPFIFTANFDEQEFNNSIARKHGAPRQEMAAMGGAGAGLAGYRAAREKTASGFSSFHHPGGGRSTPSDYRQAYDMSSVSSATPLTQNYR